MWWKKRRIFRSLFARKPFERLFSFEVILILIFNRGDVTVNLEIVIGKSIRKSACIHFILTQSYLVFGKEFVFIVASFIEKIELETADFRTGSFQELTFKNRFNKILKCAH